MTDLLARDPGRVTLAGGWSDRPFPLRLPGGIADRAGDRWGNCFNLNSLVVKSDTGTAAYTPMVTQFARLMRLLVSPGGEGVAAAAADWIDSDDRRCPVEPKIAPTPRFRRHIAPLAR